MEDYNVAPQDGGGRRPQQLQLEMLAFLGRLGAKGQFPREQVERSIGGHLTPVHLRFLGLLL